MLTTVQIEAALRQRYSGQEWAYLPQVRNGTGFVRGARTADGLAMSLWPSRGLALHGFEVKSYRSDWLKELSQPAKAEEICQFCDHWWVVVGDESIVQDGELPATWGLLAPKGKKLVCKKEAPKLGAKPITKLFLAAILRQAKACVVDPLATKEALSQEYQRGLKDGGQNAEYDTKRIRGELDRLQEAVKQFEEASGIRIHHWDGGRIGEAVRALRDVQTIERYVNGLRAMAAKSRQGADFYEQQAVDLEAVLKAADGEVVTE